jgi:membrane protease YdiL (CAAX protease family)
MTPAGDEPGDLTVPPVPAVAPATGTDSDTDSDPGLLVAPPLAGTPPARPGLSTFTIEGRAAPALFVVGWLATILGGGIAFIGYLAPRTILVSLLILGGYILLSIGLVSASGSQALERRARGVTTYAGPSPFLLFAASLMVGSTLVSLVGIPIQLLGGDPESPLATLLFLVVIEATYLGLTRLLVVGTGALGWAEMGFVATARQRVSDLAWGASAAVPVIALTAIVAAVVSSVVNAVPESPLPPTGTPTGLLLNLIGGAVLVPIGEEVMFRGVATTAWVRVYGPARAIVQGALFFAFVHVFQVGGTSVEQALALAFVAFATRVPVALALGWLFVTRRSIWASIGLHAAFNGVLLVLAEVVRANPPTS